jgi:RAT1-interacting protein
MCLVVTARYWGYKFESLCCIEEPPSQASQEDMAARSTNTVNNNVQFCSIWKTSVGNHKLIMGGEIDCLVSDKESTSSRDYCELKTNRVLTTERQKESFEKFKLLRVWGQSFLAGVRTIIFGYRDDAGNLISTEEMKTLEIPRRVRSKGYWDPNVV